MGALTPILTAIKGALETAANPTPVYFTNVPQGVGPPFVRWEVVTTQEDEELRVYGNPDEGEATWININVWHTTQAGAVTIHDQIKEALSNANIVPTGWKPTRRARREAAQPMDDVESGLFRMWSRWSLRFCKP